MLDEILTVTFITGFLAATLRIMVPILIAALGEMFAERAGILNLGIEGIMIMGAFVGFAGAYFTGSPLLGFVAGALAGAFLGLVMGVLSIQFRANQIVAGLGIWILCQGLASFLNRSIFGIADVKPSVDILPTVGSQLPFLTDTLLDQNIMVYLTALAVPVFVFIFRRTSWGLNIDAVGEEPHAADAAGISVSRVRYVAVTFGGLMAGLGGAYLSLALFGLYTDDLSTGLGWMAIVVVVFGRWRPWWIVSGAVIFGAANALQYRLQALDFPLPYQFLLMIPFLVTLLIVVIFGRGQKGPSALSVPYERSER